MRRTSSSEDEGQGRERLLHKEASRVLNGESQLFQ